MSGEVKFGRVVDRWAVGTIANVPIIAMVHATGPVWQATGEVVPARNGFADVEAGSFVAVVDLGESAHLINVRTNYVEPVIDGPRQ